MPDLPSLGWDAVFLRVVIAAVLGAAIGVERELREREAGLRTHLLVAVGSALFTIVSAYGFHDVVGPSSGSVLIRVDPSRVAAQIVSGIGFLGAGAIIRQGLSVRGLTTAATLWIVAAIGMASGAGYYSGAVITTLVVLFSLWPLRLLAQRVIDRPHERRLAVDLRPERSAAPILAALESLGVGVESFDVEEEDGARRLQLVLDLPRGARPEVLVGRLGGLDEVKGVRWNA